MPRLPPPRRVHLGWLRSSAQSAGATQITPSEEERDAQAASRIDEALGARGRGAAAPAAATAAAAGGGGRSPPGTHQPFQVELASLLRL